MTLTEKQKQFAQEYLVDLNATQAAIRAGYSVKSADRLGYELLQKPKVREAVQAARAVRAQRTAISQDDVLNELAKIGLAQAEDSSDFPLKVGNKLKALELLGKHFGMFQDKIKISSDEGVQIIDDIKN